MSAILQTYNRKKISFKKGKGSYLYSNNGKKYLDFVQGIAVNSLGHSHPHLIKAVNSQAKKLWHVSNAFNIPEQEKLAKRLTQKTFANFVAFQNSGAEATELAIKIARKYFHSKGKPNKNRILCINNSFHGRTLATIFASNSKKMTEGFYPKVDGFDHFNFGDHKQLEKKITNKTAAIMVETIMGEGGIKVIPDFCLKGLRKLCNKKKILLILDEVQCGVGRSGKFFAFEYANIKPDIVPIAKGIGGGFPIGAVLVNKKVELPGSYDWLYVDDSEIIFHRITVQNSFSEEGIPDGHTILSLEIACSDGDKIDASSDDELINRSIEGLIELGIIKIDDVVTTHLIDAKNVYPAIFVGYEEELNKSKTITDNISNLYMHGALAEFEYSDLQVLTAKSIDLVDLLCKKSLGDSNALLKSKRVKPSIVVEIDGKKIGKGFETFIIAEIGLNHNGDVKLAKKMIDQAHRSGASAAKLQTYKKGRISPKVRTSRYYEDLVDTQVSLSEMLDNVSFSYDETRELFEYGRDKGITIFSTPFDLDSLEQLESLDCPAYKISSMDIVNLPLIKAVAAKQKPVIISTGMSDISDIQAATDSVLSTGNKMLILLHCVSSYPCPPSSANLRMINKLEDTFETVVGYSDHTTGVDIALASIAIGANVIEKHFTVDRKMDGPDQNFSILEDELSLLTSSARRIEGALEESGYGVLPAELTTAQNLRRSIFFNADLPAGHLLKESDLEIKSPGTGLHPKFLEIALNQKLKKNVSKDHPLEWDDII